MQDLCICSIKNAIPSEIRSLTDRIQIVRPPMLYHNENFIKIPVVSPKKPLTARIFNYTFWSVLSISLLSVIFINDPNNIFGKLFLLIITILLIWALLIKRPYNIIGYLVLNNAEIHFITDKHTEIFKVNDLNKIHFEYLGYQGRGNWTTLSFDSGLGNKLSFYYSDSKFNFEILLKTQHIIKLNKIITIWKINNNTVKITNSLGKSTATI